jgi:hypothetical protein
MTCAGNLPSHVRNTCTTSSSRRGRRNAGPQQVMRQKKRKSLRQLLFAQGTAGLKRPENARRAGFFR